jgi:hypothetical protein
MAHGIYYLYFDGFSMHIFVPLRNSIIPRSRPCYHLTLDCEMPLFPLTSRSVSILVLDLCLDMNFVVAFIAAPKVGFELVLDHQPMI